MHGYGKLFGGSSCLKIQIFYELVIPLLGINPKGSKENICIPVLTAALLTISKRWKTPKYLTTEVDAYSIMCVYIYNEILFSHKKKRNFVFFENKTSFYLKLVMAFPMVMYGCESWTVKKAEHRKIDAFELWCWRRLESCLDFKEIQPVHSKGDQPWVFFGRNDAKTETPVLWPPHAKS